MIESFGLAIGACVCVRVPVCLSVSVCVVMFESL